MSSLILGSEGLAFGRGIERESEGSAGRENSDWFTGGERDGFAGNILRGGSEGGGRVDGGKGDPDRLMLRGPIGLCRRVVLASIERSRQFDVQWISGSFSTFSTFCCAVICSGCWLCAGRQRPRQHH